MTFSQSLEENIKIFENLFSEDETIITRQFQSSTEKGMEFCIIFDQNMSKLDVISEYILKPLINSNLSTDIDNSSRADLVTKRIILTAYQKLSCDENEIINALLLGSIVLLIDGVQEAVIIQTKGWKDRSITEPTTEKTVRGPKEGFTESLDVNLTLIRKRVPNKDLKLIFKNIGEVTKTKICICYIEGIASEKIIKELLTRIGNIELDGVIDSQYIEEFIKDSPLSPFKTVGSTERPDMVVGKLLEGRIAVICDGTPFVLTLPFLFIEYFRVGEDYYTNYIYSTINRLFRILGFWLTISIPSIYLAVITYHQEMIPTDLALSIGTARQGVPFPTIIESLTFLTIFEILREASTRLPVAIGQTVGIVGALVIGQSAVQARLVSAPMIIIVAFTGITGFMIPELKRSVLLLRLIFLIFSSILGLYGYIFTFIGLLYYLISIRSFGVQYMLSITNITHENVKDTLLRAPLIFMKKRPTFFSHKSNKRGSHNK